MGKRLQCVCCEVENIQYKGESLNWVRVGEQGKIGSMGRDQ